MAKRVLPVFTEYLHFVIKKSMKRTIRLCCANTFLAYILFAANIACLLSSCDNDENESYQDGSNYPAYVSRETFEEFNRRYPEAIGVEWRKEGESEEYRVAGFRLQIGRAVNHEAWFDNNGNWYMTETNMETMFELLPESVRNAFNASEYADWRITEVDVLSRVNNTVIYIIEVEGTENGRKVEVDLYYSEDGILVKKVLDIDDENDYNDYDDYIISQPDEKIDEFIKQRYPGVRIIEIDKGNGMTEVEILDGVKCRELLFDSSDEWIHTKTEDVLRGDLPEVVKNAYSSSQYSNYRIDDIDFYETPSGNFYRFDLKSIDGDIKFDIKEDGTVSGGYKPSDPDYESGNGSSNGSGNGNMAGKTIQDFIGEKYPGARIVEREYDDGMIKVEIVHENREKDIYFDGAETWVMSKWDLLRSELPKKIVYIISSQYTNYKLDDVEYVETHTREEYYLVELEQGDREIKLRINKNGNIL